MNRWLALWMGAITGVAAWAAPTYAGSAVCQKCHPDVTGTFFRNPHKKLDGAAAGAAGAASTSISGCESCHGPASEHIAQPAKTNIVAFSQLRPKAFLDACLQCHANSLGRMQVRRSSHTQADLACGSCHSIHKSPEPKFLLTRRQRDLCYSCHQNVRAQFALPFKHRVNEGLMNCTDCHNPHGSAGPVWRMGGRPRMVETAGGNEEACLKCHVDKRGPFAFEHAAVRVDGCESCHQPHGSMNARMLKRPATFTLCLECHNGGGNFGRQGDGVKSTPTSHSLTDPRYQNCTLCHVRIHGSNADARFLR